MIRRTEQEAGEVSSVQVKKKIQGCSTFYGKPTGVKS